MRWGTKYYGKIAREYKEKLILSEKLPTLKFFFQKLEKKTSGTDFILEFQDQFYHQSYC